MILAARYVRRSLEDRFNSAIISSRFRHSCEAVIADRMRTHPAEMRRSGVLIRNARLITAVSRWGRNGSIMGSGIHTPLNGNKYILSIRPSQLSYHRSCRQERVERGGGHWLHNSSRDLSLSAKQGWTGARLSSPRDFHNRGMLPSPPSHSSRLFLILTGADWCMARDWSDCTHIYARTHGQRGEFSTSRGSASDAASLEGDVVGWSRWCGTHSHAYHPVSFPPALVRCRCINSIEHLIGKKTLHGTCQRNWMKRDQKWERTCARGQPRVFGNMTKMRAIDFYRFNEREQIFNARDNVCEIDVFYVLNKPAFLNKFRIKSFDFIAIRDCSVIAVKRVPTRAFPSASCPFVCIKSEYSLCFACSFLIRDADSFYLAIGAQWGTLVILTERLALDNNLLSVAYERSRRRVDSSA